MRTSAARGRTATRVPRRVVAAGAGVVALAGAWAFWPLPEPVIDERVLGVAAASSDAPTKPVLLASLDLDAFRAPMWVAPPAPPTPPPKAVPPPPPPPIRLQLLAIVREPETSGARGDAAPIVSLKALLYDPDSDTLILAVPGQTVGAATVERVLDSRVEIKDHAGVRTLALRPDDPPAAAGGGR